ncbi:hypothetical protein [Spirosoma oryzicola]|uniref:hypothetical protein n=1 Tax=Spirosoma oryzicola TaxID=2898794 RepID=UPI001E3FC9BA|nr:hypothetical protein [Spirosoma oryzicola]UHG92411.1 hypothetical protein LQ777_05780 [Spirosoma oryzicola]
MARLFLQKVSRVVVWLFCIGLTAILLGYQTVLLNDLTPSATEKLMIWLTTRTMLVMALGYGYYMAWRYGQGNKWSAWQAVLSGAALFAGGLAAFLIAGDSTLLWLAIAGILLVLVRHVGERWLLLGALVLLLNIPVQVYRWYRANCDVPFPTSDQIVTFEKEQHEIRQRWAAKNRYWIDQDYEQLVRHHATYWPGRIWRDLKTGRWSLLIGMVLLGGLAQRRRTSLPATVTTSLIAVVGIWFLSTLLGLTSVYTYATAVRLYLNSLLFPGYYVFDGPAALYLTVAEISWVSGALLIGTVIWFLAGWTAPRWIVIGQRVLRRRLTFLKIRSAA